MKVRVRFDFAAALPAQLAGAKVRMSTTLLRQVCDRIRAGGDEEVTFAPLAFPRPGGTEGKPLLGNGGLLDSLEPAAGPGWFGVKSDHPGAAVLQHGTVGKGGAMPTIRPKRSPVLAFPGPGGRTVFAKSVDIAPRPYLRLTEGNKRELVKAFAGE